jgi:AI-2 transport protein TqsA
MEQMRNESSDLTHASLTILAFAALTGLLYYGRSLLVPFVLAVFIFSMFSPTLDWLVLRLRFPRMLALTVSFTLVLIITLAVFVAIAEAIRQVVATAAAYSDSLMRMVERMAARLADWGLKVEPDSFTGDLKKSIPAVATSIASQSLDIVSTFSLVLIFLLFLMAGRDPYEVRQGVYASIDRDVRSYLLMKTALSAIMGILFAALLWLFGVQLAMVFGLLAFVLDFIPSIGSVIATVLPIPVIIAQYPDSIWRMIVIVSLLTIGQLIQGNIIQPKILGNSLHLHPIVILLAIGFWGLIWGLIGAFLAVPLTAIIRLVSLRIESLHPLARLLGGRMPEIESLPSTA